MLLLGNKRSISPALPALPPPPLPLPVPTPTRVVLPRTALLPHPSPRPAAVTDSIAGVAAAIKVSVPTTALLWCGDVRDTPSIATVPVDDLFSGLLGDAEGDARLGESLMCAVTV